MSHKLNRTPSHRFAPERMNDINAKTLLMNFKKVYFNSNYQMINVVCVCVCARRVFPFVQVFNLSIFIFIFIPSVQIQSGTVWFVNEIETCAQFFSYVFVRLAYEKKTHWLCYYFRLKLGKLKEYMRATLNTMHANYSTYSTYTTHIYTFYKQTSSASECSKCENIPDD